MTHLNEDTLIRYTFDLMDGSDRKVAEHHLDGCGWCREALGQLQAKFAVMDVLADETPSEVLIQQTLAVSHSGGRSIPLYRRRWFVWPAAAAAVVFACLLTLQNLPDSLPKSSPPTVTHTLPPSDVPLPGPEVAEPALMQAALTPAAGARDGVRIVDPDEIPNKPPFAPASAIELVVLPRPEAMQLTIYNSADLTLVRDTRKLTLKPGWNWLQFMWDETLIDPTSLSLRPLEHADKVDIQQLVFPARLKDIGRWLIRSEVEGAVPFEITYFASGLSWRAFYMGTMNEDETTMDLKGYVHVANHSGQDFENAQTRLIVGQTRLTEEIPYLARRRYPYGPDIPDDKSNRSGLGQWKEEEELVWDQFGFVFNGVNGDMDLGAGVMGGMGGGAIIYHEIKAIEKEGLSEYFLYTIEGTENLPNTWAKRLESLDVSDIPVKSLYKYDEDRYGTDTIRFVSFTNDTEHELGTTPIPEGNVKLYRTVNDRQNLSYVGETDVKYIPVNEAVELNLGPAQRVKVEPMLMDRKTDHYTFDNKGNINGWDEIETWSVKLTNAGEIAVEAEVTRNFGVEEWDIAIPQGQPAAYEKLDVHRARFTAALPARSEEILTYTVTKYLNERAAVIAKERQGNSN